MEYILQGDYANALDEFDHAVQSVEVLLAAPADVASDVQPSAQDLHCSHLHYLLDKVRA